MLSIFVQCAFFLLIYLVENEKTYNFVPKSLKPHTVLCGAFHPLTKLKTRDLIHFIN